MIRYGVKIITVAMAGGCGGVGPGAHFLIKNAVTKRLHRIQFIRVGGKAHAQIAGAQFFKARFGRCSFVLVDWHQQSRLRAAQFRMNPRVTNRAWSYRADWEIAKTADLGLAKAREIPAQAIGI
jgi:hypothetical protein